MAGPLGHNRRGLLPRPLPRQLVPLLPERCLARGCSAARGVVVAGQSTLNLRQHRLDGGICQRQRSGGAGWLQHEEALAVRRLHRRAQLAGLRTQTRAAHDRLQHHAALAIGGNLRLAENLLLPIRGRPHAGQRRLRHRGHRFLAIGRRLGHARRARDDHAIHPQPAQGPRAHHEALLPRRQRHVRRKAHEQRAFPSLANAPVVVAHRQARQEKTLPGPARRLGRPGIAVVQPTVVGRHLLMESHAHLARQQRAQFGGDFLDGLDRDALARATEALLQHVVGQRAAMHRHRVQRAAKAVGR